MIRVNFRDDWKEFLQRDLVTLGLQYESSESPEENTITYLNAKRRTIPRRKRTVHESKELNIPPDHLTDYSLLKKVMRKGAIWAPI